MTRRDEDERDRQAELAERVILLLALLWAIAAAVLALAGVSL